MKQEGVGDPAVGVGRRETNRDERPQEYIAAITSMALLRTGKRTGRPPIFDDEEKARLIASITHDSRARRLSWEAICIEMDYACGPKTAKCHDFTKISHTCTRNEVQRKTGQQSLILSSLPAERSSAPQPMYEWSLGPLLCRFGISVARNMNGILCKRITLQGIKGMPKPTES